MKPLATVNKNQITIPSEQISRSIQNSLITIGFDKAFNLQEEDVKYVAEKFKTLGLSDSSNVTYALVKDIGSSQFNHLNKSLKEITSKMSEIKTPGLFNLIGDLTQEVDEAGLEKLWDKAVNAKPSFKARLMSFISPNAANESLSEKYSEMVKDLITKGKGLEAKIGEIEKSLISQQRDQERNMKTLSDVFENYYYTVNDLRKDFALILALEEQYKRDLEEFKSSSDITSFENQKLLKEKESLCSDIESKRILFHGSLIRIPIIAGQCQDLTDVCKNILKEIDNTRQVSFPLIRGNLIGLGVSLNAKQSLIGTESAKVLDRQSALLSQKISGSLMQEAQLFASESRLKEAETIKTLIENVKQLKDSSSTMKLKAQENLDQATLILNEATQEYLQVLESNFKDEKDIN